MCLYSRIRSKSGTAEDVLHIVIQLKQAEQEMDMGVIGLLLSFIILYGLDLIGYLGIDTVQSQLFKYLLWFQ